MQQRLIPILLALGAGLAGGVAGALLVAPSNGDAAPRDADPGPSRSAERAADGALEEQLAAMRARLDVLDEGALLPRSVPQRVPADGGPGDTTSRLAQLEAEVEALGLRIDALELRSRPTTEAVADAIEELETERRVEKAEARLNGDRESIDKRVSAWSDWLDLDSVQADQVRTAFLAQSERDEALLFSWAAGTNEEMIGEMKRSNAEIHRAEIEAILRPEQLTRFRERRGGGKED